MLQTKLQLDTIHQPAEPEIMTGAESLQSFLGFLRRQLPVIAFVTLLSLALSGIYLITARPSYTGEAQLLIDARKVQVFQQQSILGDIPIDTAQVESQVEVLKSEKIAAAVIKQLHLTTDPEFVGPGNGLWGLAFHYLFSQLAPDRTESEFELERKAIKTFQEQLSVKRAGLTYVIQINFRSFSADRAAEIANAVAEAYFSDQLEAKYETTRRAGTWLQDRIKELREQVSNAERAVVEFKTKHNIINTGNADKQSLAQQQVAELSSQLVIARAHTAEARARLDRIDSVLKADPTASLGATVADTLKSDVVSKLRSQYLELAARESDWSAKYGRTHIAVVNLRNQMHEIRNNIFEELKRLGETYKSDFEIAKQREEGVQKELAQAVTRSQATDAASVSLRELESTAQTYKTLYDNFLQRYMESVQQQSFPITEARLIATATRPLQKSSPKTLLVLAIGLLGGLAFGIAVGKVRDLLDRVFRTSEQVENLLETDCIAFVPLLTGDETNLAEEKPAATRQNAKDHPRGQNDGLGIANLLLSRAVNATRSSALVSDLHGSIKSVKSNITSFASSISDEPAQKLREGAKPAEARAGSRMIECGNMEYRNVVDAPLSRFSEAIRSIKLAVDLNEAVNSKRSIGVTSALPNEGKSTISAALARLLSQVGLRTILVDCDLRNPSLSRILAPDATDGLLDVILKRVSLEEVIWKDPITNMAFLPTVAKSRLVHSSEVLGSTHIAKLFEELREKYDYIVVDFSPLAPVVDVRATRHLVDSYIYVIEWGQTKIDVVKHALSRAPSVHQNLLGVVLNKVDMNLFGRYTGTRQKYYYNKDYGRYGYTE